MSDLTWEQDGDCYLTLRHNLRTSSTPGWSQGISRLRGSTQTGKCGSSRFITKSRLVIPTKS